MAVDSYLFISSAVQMEMLSPFVATGMSLCARYQLNPVVPCGNGMKDKVRGESCNPLSPEREPEPRLDRPDESACFTPLNNFFIMHSTCNDNTQQEVPTTLGLSFSVRRMGGRKQKVV
jgi:hypothetical protein